MKIKIFSLISVIFINLMICDASFADMLYLKNGSVMKGGIEAETDTYVVINLGFGSTKIYRKKIEKIEKSDAEEKDKLVEEWEQQAEIRQEKHKKYREEYAKKVQENLERIKSLQQPEEPVNQKPERDDVKYISRRNSVGVEAVINGRHRVKLLVDTGASSVMINGRAAQNMGLVSRAGYKCEVTLADGSSIMAREISLDSVKVGNMKADDVHAIILTGDKGVSGWDGLLGMSFLKKFVFKIDAETGKLILERERD